MKRFDSALLRDLETALRSARIAGVRAALARVPSHSVHRADRATVANLAWRAGLVDLAITLLNPLVRTRGRAASGTPREKAEYAAALIRMGAPFEAREILAGIPESTYAESLLYQAFALIPEWNYRAAIPLLNRYCGRVSSDPYRLLVGRVNLLAALIFEGKLDEAEALVPGLIRSAQKQGADRLLGNCVQLAAQVSLFQEDFSRCARRLEEARGLLKASPTQDAFFIRKWMAILELRSGRVKQGLRSLEAVRAESTSRREWETLRECNFYRALATRDTSLLNRVYYGTPHSPYREMVLRDSRSWYSPPADYVWDPSGARKQKRILDVESGMELGTRIRLKPGQLPHRLLHILASDFYRRHRPVPLFAQLFPGEHFSPVTSIARVHNVIMNTRRWLSRCGIPLAITEIEGHYHIDGKGPYGLRRMLASQSSPPSPVGALLRRLEVEFSGAVINRQAVTERLGLSQSGAIRLLKDAITRGKIEPLGSGPSRRYRIRRSI